MWWTSLIVASFPVQQMVSSSWRKHGRTVFWFTLHPPYISYTEFTTFIDDTLDASSPSFFIGLLQSSFIIGICVASPVFATLAHTRNTFSLILSGMIVWTISALISGSAYYINSYEVLLCGRMLSGVGEAAFMCCTSPWIATNAPSKSKSKWLAIFFSAMPIGTAVGYIYSSILATSIGWQWAFFIEGTYFTLVPYYIFCLSILSINYIPNIIIAKLVTWYHFYVFWTIWQ